MEFTPYLQILSSFFPSYPLIAKPSLPFTVLILSPHPDDESLTGTLALRLMLENNAHVINVAVTLGSKKERQKARRKELEEACELLDMDLDLLSDNWSVKAKELKILLQKYRPQLIIAPHLKDHHPTHIKTSQLLKKVLKGSKLKTLVAWSEFWAPLEKPNCLLEVPLEIVELQMKALERHVGEIKRNPYHLRLPAWMMDNVRRGGELISNVGGDVPQIPFGILYQIELFKNDKFGKIKLPASTLTCLADLGQIFNEILEAASGSKTKVK
jgi:LmbE family N-acetylglucosaminyl deacetylase